MLAVISVRPHFGYAYLLLLTYYLLLLTYYLTMSIDPELRDRVYQMFILEVPKMLQTIETELVTLSSDRSLGKVKLILRAAHSIKGCAASLGLMEIQDLAHQTEDIFRILNHPELPWSRELERLLFELYDSLAQLINCEINQTALPPGASTKTLTTLVDLDDEIGHFVIAGQAIPDMEMFGVDLTRSIFEVDVAVSLAKLRQVLADPAFEYILAGEFRAQAEVFRYIAELIALPGFGSLANLTISALDRHPYQVREVCTLALADFNRALAAVLNGDRQIGGRVSDEFATFFAQPPQTPHVIHFDDANVLLDLEEIFELQSCRMNELEFDLVADFINESNAYQIAPFAPEDIVDDPDLDYLIEDFFTPADNLNFDLLDIFDSATRLDLALRHNRHQEIQTAIEAITNSFERLEPLSQTQLLHWKAVTNKPQSAPTHRSKKARQVIPIVPQLTIRVALDRLERMNNLVGELAIERNGLALHSEQSINVLNSLKSKLVNFQTIGDKLRQLADNLSIAARYTTFDPAHSAADLQPEFDLLELDRYGELHNLAQETVEQLAQIDEQVEDFTLFTKQSESKIDRQKQLLNYLRDDLMWARMLPLGEILNRFPRTIHDLSVKYHKPCDLKITGAGVLVDRAAIDKLLDPLIHILRNAFDHGIDTPAARQAAGKPPRGLIDITAYHQGSQTIIEVRDDGVGIDLDQVKAKAIDLGILPPDTNATREQILDTLFSPGFSTVDRVTELSGRGMGLDIVKATIQSIKGTIEIQSQPGRGTTFTLRVPLTLTIAQLTICAAGNSIYAFPADSIQRIIIPTIDQIEQQGDLQLLHWHNLHIPIYNLASLLTYSIPVHERTISYTLKSSPKNPTHWLAPILLIRTGDRAIGLQIDQTIGEQELTIKPFGKAIAPASYSYGCTILGDGSILPVLDPHTLIRSLIDREQCHLPSFEPIPAPISSTLILVVDDSITTRQSLCLTLEKYGYRTLQAKDGQEALQLLREKVTEIKLTICDVEMPNMNGFEFLNIRRQDSTLTHTPVAMLTSRSNKKHREFATHLGAIDYFIKPYVEVDFIKAIKKLLGIDTPRVR